MKQLIKMLPAPVLLVMALPLAAAAQQYAYVAQTGSTGDFALVKVEITSNTVVATLPVGLPPAPLAVTPDGAHVYFVNEVDPTVYVVDAATFTLETAIPVGVEPGAVAITHDGSYVYVLDLNDIEVIKTDSNAVVSVLPTGYTPRAIAFSHDGTLAYITDGGSTMHVLQVGTNVFLAPITVSGAALNALAASPAGSSLYAIDALSSRVLFINASTGAVARTVTVPLAPIAIAVAPDGSVVYVTDTEDASSSVGSLLSISLGGTIRRVRVGFEPNSVALSYPDGKFAYVSNPGGTVSVIDTATSVTYPHLPPFPVEFVATQPSPYVPLIHYQPILFFQISLEEAVLMGTFGLGPGNNGLGLPQSDLTLEIADFTLTIPAKSFQKDQAGGFTFGGNVGSIKVQAVIDPVKGGGYQSNFQLDNAPLKGLVNPVTVRMIVGNNIGGALIKAQITQ